MKPFIITAICLFLFVSKMLGGRAQEDSIPSFYNQPLSLNSQQLIVRAAEAFVSAPIPSAKDWEKERTLIKAKIILKTGAILHQNLDLNVQVLKTIRRNTYRIEHIIFQTRPGIYTTANLYVPNGSGPFPGVITMMGHSRNGKLADAYQSVGHTLALNGYVSLHIDPWGAGERTTEHGNFEYHGANLGASLMNIGESLMGMQITDNIRGVDLLSSLPYVDRSKIGATGASGGGNQTMWLTAIDERIKASVPVVSVGSFQSYIMNSNCVCELLIDGLTVCEEASVLGLIAPRPLLIANAQKDSNPAFFPSEMKKSYAGAKEIFAYYKKKTNLSYFIADTTHGYHPPFRKAMLSWFDLHLKGTGNGEPRIEQDFELLKEEDLMVFEKGARNERVKSTADYCHEQGKNLKAISLNASAGSSTDKKNELKQMLRISKNDSVLRAHHYPDKNEWERVLLETRSGKYIPVLFQKPGNGGNYTLILSSPKKYNFNLNNPLTDSLLKERNGVILIELWGSRESVSHHADLLANRKRDTQPLFHDFSRSLLWLGESTMGIWTEEINTVINYFKREYKAHGMEIVADKEYGIASLFASIFNDHIHSLTLIDTPLSYLFDKKGNVDYYNMSIHLPGILTWGDITLAAALSDKTIRFIQPRSIAGRALSKEEIAECETEFSIYKKKYQHTLNATLTIKTP